MSEEKGRSPPVHPLEYVRLEAGAGEFKVAMAWQPRTGILKFKVSGADGNELAVSKKFDLLKAEKVSDVIKHLRGVFASVLDEENVEAASKVVSGMMSILPDSAGKKRETSS